MGRQAKRSKAPSGNPVADDAAKRQVTRLEAFKSSMKAQGYTPSLSSADKGRGDASIDNLKGSVVVSIGDASDSATTRATTSPHSPALPVITDEEVHEFGGASTSTPVSITTASCGRALLPMSPPLLCGTGGPHSSAGSCSPTSVPFASDSTTTRQPAQEEQEDDSSYEGDSALVEAYDTISMSGDPTDAPTRGRMLEYSLPFNMSSDNTYSSELLPPVLGFGLGGGNTYGGVVPLLPSSVTSCGPLSMLSPMTEEEAGDELKAASAGKYNMHSNGESNPEMEAVHDAFRAEEEDEEPPLKRQKHEAPAAAMDFAMQASACSASHVQGSVPVLPMSEAEAGYAFSRMMGSKNDDTDPNYDTQWLYNWAVLT